MSFFKIIVFFIFFSSNLSFAKVNLATGQFHHHEIDFSYEKGLVDFDLWRAYNSQSQKVGLFGLGWCSNIEYRLEKNEYGSYDLVWCHQLKKSFRAKKKNQKFFRLPRVSLKVGQNEIYYHNDLGSDKLFDKTGRLIQIILDSNRSPIDIKYKKENIEIKLQSKQLKIKTHQGKVKKVVLGRKKVANYRYKNQYLKNVRAGRKKFNQYHYNEKKRLTKITKKDGTFFEVAYEKNNFVRQFSESDVCEEKYKYSLARPKLVKVSKRKVCMGRIFSERTYFISFNEKNKVQAIYEGGDGKVVQFESEDGTLKMVRTPIEIKKYKYDKKKRVKEFSYRSTEKEYSVKLAYEMGFKINKLLYKQNGKVNTVKLGYNERGQLKKLLGYEKEDYNLYYNKKQLTGVQKNKDKLFYRYDKNRNLKAVNLVKNKKKFTHEIKGKKNKIEDADSIAKFLNEMYMSMGPAYENSHLLREVF